MFGWFWVFIFGVWVGVFFFGVCGSDGVLGVGMFWNEEDGWEDVGRGVILDVGGGFVWFVLGWGGLGWW